MSSDPLNISPREVSGLCDLKCALSFSYPRTALVAKNNGIAISCTPDNTNVPPVTFNLEKYEMTKINISYPSMHLFNGARAEGELIIDHSPVLGGNPLKICVPIVQSRDPTLATDMVTSIIDAVAKSAPSENETIAISTEITINDLLPNKPYFSYANPEGNFVVFPPTNGIPLPEAAIDVLHSVVRAFDQSSNAPNGVFLNKSGPNTSSSSGEGIYISCQPTGSSKEEVNIVYDTNSESGSLFKWVGMSSTKIAAIFLVLIVLIIGFVQGVNAGITYLA